MAEGNERLFEGAHPHAGMRFWRGLTAVARRGSSTALAAVTELILADHSVLLNVMMMPRDNDNVRFAFNYGDTVWRVPAPEGAHFVLGSRETGPSEVAAWVETH